MDHFDRRCAERVGYGLDRRFLAEGIESGAFELVSAAGGREEYSVRIGRAEYVVAYDRPSRRLVTLFRRTAPACLFKKKRTRGKRRKTAPKKTVPLRSYGRMSY